MDKMVSVIIPIYKTEAYLEKCIESVLKQRDVELEIILVDDGSPDGCPAICDRFAEKHANITVIHKVNEGMAVARTVGLERAGGEYLYFLDSDDLLDGEHGLYHLLQKAQETGADITVGGFRRITGDQISEINVHHLQGGEYTKSEDFRFKGFYMYGHLAYNWGKLYRRSFLLENDLRCPSYPFTQDKAHNMRCCACEPQYAFIQESSYLYRDNESSVTYKYKENFIPVWVSIATDFQDFLKERDIRRDYGDLTAFHAFFGSFFLVKQELMHSNVIGATKKVREYCSIPFVREQFKMLAKGRYLKNISSGQWKVVIRVASILVHMHLYGVMTVGIAMLRSMKVDRYITNKRYRKGQKPE